MKKGQLISLSILLIISASLGYASLTSGHNWAYSDFASYIMQAKSILALDMDGFIAQNAITILQSDLPVGPVAYPWGYPLLPVPVVALTELSTLSMKLLNTFLFLSFLSTLYFLARKRLQHFDSLALVALFAVNPIFLISQDSILSDIAFLFLSTFAIFFDGLLGFRCVAGQSKIFTADPDRAVDFRRIPHADEWLAPASELNCL